MKALVYLRRRYGRRLSSREENGALPLVGIMTLLSLKYLKGESVEVLSLRRVNDNTPEGVLAALYEPKLLGLINGWIMFRGFEGHAGDDGPIGYVQEWRCCVGEELYAGENNPQKR